MHVMGLERKPKRGSLGREEDREEDDFSVTSTSVMTDWIGRGGKTSWRPALSMTCDTSFKDQGMLQMLKLIQALILECTEYWK